MSPVSVNCQGLAIVIWFQLPESTLYSSVWMPEPPDEKMPAKSMLDEVNHNPLLVGVVIVTVGSVKSTLRYLLVMNVLPDASVALTYTVWTF